jgi:hypothetical protein
MPALRLMVVKQPLLASNLITEAPMQSCGQFHLSSISESQLTPMLVEAGHTLTPDSSEVCLNCIPILPRKVLVTQAGCGRVGS